MLSMGDSTSSSPKSRVSAVEAIRALIEAIILEPDGDELKITLTGDLAGMLSTCSCGAGRRDLRTALLNRAFVLSCASVKDSYLIEGAARLTVTLSPISMVIRSSPSSTGPE